MPQSLAQIYLHLIFSTKNRTPFLKDRAFREELHAYLGGICRNTGSPPLIVGGVEDHVHILCRFSRTISIADFLKALKQESSRWAKRRKTNLREFHWQAGYGAFSISPADVPRLRQYIANQEEHHRQESFEEELRRILMKYGVEYDEEYVWD